MNDCKKHENDLPNVGSLSMATNCFVSSLEAIVVDGLWKGKGLCVNCDPGALLCELFDPTDDVDADSDTSLLPFCT